MRTRLEEIAEIGFVFATHFFRRRFTTMLGVRGIVFNAHLANVQFRITCFADLETPQR